jgi:hypothetical protein
MKILTPLIFQKFALIAAFATAISATASQAQTLVVANLADPSTSVVEPPTGGPNGPEPRTYENDGDLGFIFQVGTSNLLVSSLGVYAPNSDLPWSTAVDLYKILGNTDTITGSDPLIATATVTAGAAPDSQGFAYATAPALLLAGQQYAIYYVDSSVDEFYDAQFNSDGTSAQLSSLFDTTDITPLSNLLNAANSSNDYYVSANAKFTPTTLTTLPTTPEPSSLALLLAGLGTLALVARLRSRNA